MLTWRTAAENSSGPWLCTAQPKNLGGKQGAGEGGTARSVLPGPGLQAENDIEDLEFLGDRPPTHPEPPAKKACTERVYALNINGAVDKAFEGKSFTEISEAPVGRGPGRPP